MRFGDITVRALETGFFKLDGGAMFGTVPKPLWEKAIPPDEQNRIPMALRVVLISDAKTGRHLLIDTGIGHKWAPKYEQIYAIDHSKHTLEDSLKAVGLGFNDITDVVLTHLHFDHAGGATYRTEDGVLKPRFPRATYYIQRANVEWATAPNSREAASYLPENFEPLSEVGALKICDGVADFEKQVNWPGLSVYISNGHTLGLQCPIVRTAGETFFYPSDLIPTSAHLPIPWVMGYDIHVIKVLDEKEEILQKAADEKWILIYEHDPIHPATRVKKGPKHFERGEIFSSI